MKFRFMRIAISLLLILAGEGFALTPLRAQSGTRNQLSQGTEKLATQSGFLGVAVNEMDSDRASRFKLSEERGVIVTHVAQGSPADRAGIIPEDVLLIYNGENILSIQQFVRLVRETPVGRKVKMQIWRNERPVNVVVTIATVPMEAVTPPANFTRFDESPSQYPSTVMEIPTPILVWRNMVLGALLEELDKPMAQFFGVKGGMLVRSIENNSPAARAGLRVGDVIVRIGSDQILTARDLSSYFRSQQRLSETATALIAMRDHREVTLHIITPNYQR